MHLTSGTRLGCYEIIAPIGAGGMGEVYRARDTRLGREIAVKVLPEGVASDPDRLARFEREAKTVAALNHPSIVTLHSIEEAGGVRFLTMELVGGESLDRLVRPGGLPLPRVLDLAIPLADALVAAHARGVVHRDLKPSNVMVTREGRLKVLDFGLAKLAEAGPSLDASQAMTVAAPISSVGEVVGTVPYMAPEQLLGEPVDARSDLFSFGILLYELATGRRPFTGTTAAEISSAILRDTPPPALSLRLDLPRDVDRVISRCLEKDPERRFQTAKDVRNELELVRRERESGVASGTRAVPAAAPEPAQDLPSIAVLPFVNMSRDEENEYFSDGLAEELLNLLAKIRGLRVAARTSSFQFKGKHEDLAVIGRKLNVATLLEGSVRKAGNRVRIGVQLVKMSDGYQLWSETYDRTLDDIFAVQDEIAQAVVKELRTTLMGGTPDTDATSQVRAEVAAAAQGRGSNSEAHRLYLQARFLLDRLNQSETERAIGHLREALRLDPTYALAWVCLAQAHANQAGWGWASVDEATAAAREAVARALALAPDLPEAIVLVGRIQVSYDHDWKAAATSCRRALELAPGNADVLSAAGSLAMYEGRAGEAIELMQRAVEQDPLSSIRYSQLGFSLRLAQRYAEAEVAYRKSLELAPQRVAAHLVLAIVLCEAGRLDEALLEAKAEPAPWARLTGLAVVHHALGHAAEADAALRQLEAEFAAESAYQIAAVHSVRGDREAMFAWLERAHREHDAGLVMLKCEPVFRPHHDDPRWTVLMRELGF